MRSARPCRRLGRAEQKPRPSPSRTAVRRPYRVLLQAASSGCRTDVHRSALTEATPRRSGNRGTRLRPNGRPLPWLSSPGVIPGREHRSQLSPNGTPHPGLRYRYARLRIRVYAAKNGFDNSYCPRENEFERNWARSVLAFFKLMDSPERCASCPKGHHYGGARALNEDFTKCHHKFY